jgi:hypothetical protein
MYKEIHLEAIMSLDSESSMVVLPVITPLRR